MIDCIIVQFQFPAGPHATDGIPGSGEGANACAHPGGVAIRVNPVKHICIDRAVVLMAPGLHQSYPFIEDGGFDPAGVLAETLPQIRRDAEDAKAGEIAFGDLPGFGDAAGRRGAAVEYLPVLARPGDEIRGHAFDVGAGITDRAHQAARSLGIEGGAHTQVEG